MRLDSGDYWTPEPFQDEYVADVFAGIPEVWLVVPEGNGKTTLLSGIALYHADHVPEASVAMAASSRDQCGLLLGQAIGFVRRSPGFEKRFRTYEGYRRIDAKRTGGRIQVFAADDRTGDGVIITLALCDELHRHRSLRLYRTWRGKLAKRGGQLLAISTAGDPGSEFEIVRDRARTESPDIRVEGRHTRAAGPELVLHEHALSRDDDPTDIRLVKRANPFSGITDETLERKFASPTMTLGHWRRFVCNLATRDEGAAVGETEWADALDQDALPPDGTPCEIGLDLGWKWDATAAATLFRTGDGWLLGPTKVLVPPRDGNSLAPAKVQAGLRGLHDRFPIERAVLDPAAGGELIADWLETELGVEVVSHSQKSGPMALAAGRFMEALRDRSLHHVGDPDLTRHVLNAVAVDLPDGTFKFARPAASRGGEEGPRREIDALIAASIVLSAAIGSSSYSGPLLEVLA